MSSPSNSLLDWLPADVLRSVLEFVDAKSTVFEKYGVVTEFADALNVDAISQEFSWEMCLLWLLPTRSLRPNPPGLTAFTTLLVGRLLVGRIDRLRGIPPPGKPLRSFAARAVTFWGDDHRRVALEKEQAQLDGWMLRDHDALRADIERLSKHTVCVSNKLYPLAGDLKHILGVMFQVWRFFSCLYTVSVSLSTSVAHVSVKLLSSLSG